MKIKLLFTATLVALLFTTNFIKAQAPTLGTAANFVLFTTNGAVSNSGISQYTGNVGAKIGAITGFGNVNGQVFSGGPETNQASTDLLSAYNQLDAAIPDSTLPAVIGNGATLGPGVYLIPEPATLSLNLFLDAKGDANAVFIFQVEGTFSSTTSSKIKLLNGALACKVFWKVEGAVNLATGTNMKGTIVANNGAISMNTNDTLEGRALSTTGAILVSGVAAFTPIGCGSPVLSGPAAPALASTECYTIFSSNGSVTNAGVTFVTGDIGTNVGITSGFNAGNVTGTIHPSPDVSTATCASDLNTVYNYLNVLPRDIELQYPNLFGRDLVLTPHTYLMNSAAVLTDTLYLDAQNRPNAVFVIRIIGAFSTSINSRVRLINGAQAKNVFWNVVGAVSINDNSIFCGTIVSSGAIELKSGANINGRTLTKGGAVNTAAITATMPPGCSVACPAITSEPSNQTVCAGSSASFSVVASGTGLSYQWRNGTTNLINSGSISGATSATLTINPSAVGNVSVGYNVIVSAAGCPNDTSNFVSLVVNAPPTITTEPNDLTACSGGSASFSAIATGTAITYQWRKGATNLSNTGNISGATSSTLVLNPVSAGDAATNYNVIVSGTCTPKDTSVNAVLVVNTGVLITSQPISQSVCAGASVSFTATASGSGLSYQWRKGAVNLSNGGNISGATTNTLTINPTSVADSSSNYNLVVTGGCIPGSTTNPASLTVNPVPSASGTISGPSNVCQNQTGVNFSVSTVAFASTYTWSLPTGATITSGTGTKNITVSFNGAAVGGNITVTATNSCGTSASSPALALTVSSGAAADAGTITGPSLACQGQSGLIYTVPVINNAATYTWTLPAGATITSGANTNSITVALNGSAVGGNINVQGSSSCGSGAVSSNFALAVSILPSSPGTISGTPSICQGQSGFVYSVPTIANATGYLWTLPSGVTITSGNNTNSITVAFSGSAVSGNIIVNGVNSCGNGPTSANFAVNVLPLPSASGILSGPLSVCQGQTGVSYTLPGGTNTAEYSWITPAGDTVITVNNTLNINFGPSATSGTLTVQGRNSCGTGTTSSIFITVHSTPAAAAGILSGSDMVCQGQTSVVYTVPTIAEAFTYLWTVPAGATITGGDGTNTITVDFSAIAASGIITVQGSNGCGTGAISPNFLVTVNQTPIINSLSNQILCANSMTTAVTFSSQVGGTTYNWINSNATIGLSASGTGNIASFTATNTGTDTAKATITVTPMVSACPGLSTSFTISVIAQPVSIASTNSPVCEGATINLFAQTATNASYSWTGPNGYSSLVQNPVISNASQANAGSYALTAIANGCSSTSSVVIVSVNACGSTDLSILKTVNNSNPAIGQTVIFKLVASNIGTSNATGVIVTDLVTSGYTFVSSSSPASFNALTGIWSIVTLSAGASVELSITLRVNPTGNYLNTASIIGIEAEQNMTNNVSTASTSPITFKVTDGFSPNGDGINDEYVISGLENYPNNSIQIFNRWGNKVFQASPYKNNWDGKSTEGIRIGNNEVPLGTYFFVLDLGDGSPVIKGTIYQNR